MPCARVHWYETANHRTLSSLVERFLSVLRNAVVVVLASRGLHLRHGSLESSCASCTVGEGQGAPNACEQGRRKCPITIGPARVRPHLSPSFSSSSAFFYSVCCRAPIIARNASCASRRASSMKLVGSLHSNRSVAWTSSSFLFSCPSVSQAIVATAPPVRERVLFHFQRFR